MAGNLFSCLFRSLQTLWIKVTADGYVLFDKKAKPKDRIYYKSSYDKEVFDQVKQLVEEHKLKFFLVYIR